MKNKKLLILIGIMCALTIGAYFAFNKSKKKYSIQVNEKEFTVADTASITKLFISTKDGKNTLLERTPKGWILNKTYFVRKELLDEILYTFNAIRIQKTVSQNARNNVIKELATQGIKVEIYIANELAKVFYIGGPTLDNMGTYFIMEGSENPYVLHIPGFNGYLSTRFDVKESDMRSKLVFGSTPKSLKELSIKHYANTAEDFTLRNDVSQISIEGISDVDSAMVNRVMNSFYNITLERFVEDTDKRLYDSLTVITPTYQINLVDMNNDYSNTITIFSNPNEVDRMLALYGTKNEVVTVQRGQFEPILFKKSDFKKKKK